MDTAAFPAVDATEFVVIVIFLFSTGVYVPIHHVELDPSMQH
jgi:hypothetical protein